jgi:hypothetical protein
VVGIIGQSTELDILYTGILRSYQEFYFYGIHGLGFANDWVGYSVPGTKINNCCTDSAGRGYIDDPRLPLEKGR